MPATALRPSSRCYEPRADFFPHLCTVGKLLTLYPPERPGHRVAQVDTASAVYQRCRDEGKNLREVRSSDYLDVRPLQACSLSETEGGESACGLAREFRFHGD